MDRGGGLRGGRAQTVTGWVVTDKWEAGGKDEVDPIAVHGEGDCEVGGQAAPDEELVDGRPIVGVQAQLQETRGDHSSSSRPLVFKLVESTLF